MKGALAAGCAALGTSLMAATATAAPPSAPPPPNILLILADDVGVEAFGCYGGSSYATPNIDQLARTGLQFNHAYACPLCTPSRVQLLTGQYNFRNYQAFGWLDPDQTTFAEVLRGAGYATAIAGKWQLSDPAAVMKIRTAPGTAAPRVKAELIRDGYGFDDYNLFHLNKKGSRYWSPLIERNGELLATSTDDYGPDMSVSFLGQFMRRSRDSGKPFLAYYAMELPHNPWVPTPSSVGDRDRTTSKPDNFKDNIEYVDELVGRLVKQVDELGIRDNTLIIFAADNGTSPKITSQTVGGKVTGGKGSATDAGTHVPFIINRPGSITPGTSDRLVDFTDLFPTLLQVAGARPPEGLVLDGKALLPGRDGEPAQDRQTVYLSYDSMGFDGPKAHWVRDRRYKLHADGRLFDVSRTPLERDEDVIRPGSETADAQLARQRLEQALAQYIALHRQTRD